MSFIRKIQCITTNFKKWHKVANTYVTCFFSNVKIITLKIKINFSSLSLSNVLQILYSKLAKKTVIIPLQEF